MLTRYLFFFFEQNRSNWQGRQLHWTTWSSWDSPTSSAQSSTALVHLNVSSLESLIISDPPTRSSIFVFWLVCWPISWVLPRRWSFGTIRTIPVLSPSRRWGPLMCKKIEARYQHSDYHNPPFRLTLFAAFPNYFLHLTSWYPQPLFYHAS